MSLGYRSSQKALSSSVTPPSGSPIDRNARAPHPVFPGLAGACPECHSPWLVCLPMKVREVMRMLERDGWALVRRKGSHRQYRHPTKLGRVTLAGNLGHELPKGTLASILKQAQLEVRDE